MASSQASVERATLGTMAVAGIVVYQVILVAPFVLLLSLNPWSGFYGPWPYVAVALFFMWALQPSSSVPGVALPREEAPGLHAEVDRLADRVGAPRVHEVRLFESYNAAAMEVAWRWQPWRKRRVLLLGIPLLGLSDTRTVLSVVAHELGHFSHRHGRLGHWIYRARVEWESFAREPLESTSILERGAAAFAHWFAPRFSQLAFRYSRSCEYEADAYGAEVVGRLPMAGALLTVAVLGKRWEKLERDSLSSLVADQAEPPRSWLGHVQAQLLAQPISPEEVERLKEEPADPHDTHPLTLERLASLRVSPDDARAASEQPAMVAGAAWLRDWGAVVERHDAGWHAARARHWRLEHLWQRTQRARWRQLQEAADVGLERARLELEFGDAQTAKALVLQSSPEPGQRDAQAFHLLAAAQLKLGDAQGIETLEAGIKADPRWAWPSRRLMAQHERLMESAQVTRNRRLLERAVAKRSRALGEVLGRLQQGQVSPAHLSDDAWVVLREAWRLSDVVAGAWCAGIDDVTHEGRHYPAVILVLRLRTAELQARGETEESLHDEAAHLLWRVVPEPALTLAWTVYTTEALAPELDARLAEWTAAEHPCCLVVPRPGESAAAGIRAAALR